MAITTRWDETSRECLIYWVRVGSFLPFQTTYYLNGHHLIAGELQRRGVRFRTDDHAFLWTANLEALQAAADGLDPEVIRQRLDDWTWTQYQTNQHACSRMPRRKGTIADRVLCAKGLVCCKGSCCAAAAAIA